MRFILGEDADNPGQMEPRPVFSEMEEFKTEDGTDGQWKEIARYLSITIDMDQTLNGLLQLD